MENNNPNINDEVAELQKGDEATAENEIIKENDADNTTENHTEEATENQDAGTVKTSKKKILSIVLVCVLSALVFAACVAGAFYLIDYLGVDTSVATPDETTVPVTEVQTTAPTEGPTEMTLPDGSVYNEITDWKELQKLYPDVKGWINIPNTNVNYPVLKSDEDGYGYQYYLHRNYDGSYLFAGSVFIDYRSYQGVSSKNVITHGHNMNNGTMYNNLVNYGTYSGNLSYYKQAPVILLNSNEGGLEQWIIFSVYKTNTLTRHGEFFDYLQGEFDSDAQFMNYVYNIRMRSLFNIPVPVNENDRIMTLSTCSYEYTDFRTVVVARKVRAGENVSDYINNATVNSTPYWPDVYYSDHSTTRPELTTFRTEYQKGNVSWYDGEGTFTGEEWLQTAEGNQSFTVIFLDADGSILSTQTVTHGKDAVPPADPVRPDDDYYTYVFKGWQLDYTNVDCNMTIAPSFEAILKEQQ